MVNQYTINLDELLAEVSRHLTSYGLVGTYQDNRVSDLPDIRTIRYYTTLGLLDRPIIEGRQGRYTQRHVLQLLAIKALQSRAMPLSEVQSRLFGLSESELKSLVSTLAAENQAKAKAPPPTPPRMPSPVIWKEIVVEPGLKLMCEEGWQNTNPVALETRIRNALLALNKSQDKANGGSTNGHD